MKTSRYLAIAIAGTIAATSLFAAGLASADNRMKQSEVRQLRESGRILPMEDILARVRKLQPGQVVEVELERDGDRYVYEVKLIDDADRIHKFELDAGSGEVLKRSEK
jgi:uncharacterized membrane protein YkoI